MWKLRVMGGAMVVYGVGMLVLLYTPWKDWALDHSIAEVVSTTDRRANNRIEGSVDEPMAIAGSAVVTFAGLWFLFLVPWVMNRHARSMMAMYDDDVAATSPAAEPGSGPPPAT